MPRLLNGKRVLLFGLAILLLATALGACLTFPSSGPKVVFVATTVDAGQPPVAGYFSHDAVGCKKAYALVNTKRSGAAFSLGSFGHVLITLPDAQPGDIVSGECETPEFQDVEFRFGEDIVGRFQP